ncbi:MAG: helix-turn-helix domain-containing protein [Cocleimonas sp.]
MNQALNTLSIIEDESYSLSETTRHTVENYLEMLGDHDATFLYRQIMDEVERPLLKVMMNHTNGNQSRTAACLGINRATLRSKLKRHSII